MPVLSAGSALQLPRRLDDLRRLLETVDWEGLRHEIGSELHTRLAIIGPVNAGKSTLFNAITGSDDSPVSAVPGTTRAAIEAFVGPLELVDTPGAGEPGDADGWAAARRHLQEADAVAVLLDAAAGLRQPEVDLWQAVAQAERPAVVALNKCDLLPAGDLAESVAYAEQQLAADVIPVSARLGTNVAERLLPAILQLAPGLAVALGRALPSYRPVAATQVVRHSAGLAAAAGAEPVPLLDIPVLLAVQVRMVLRIAAIYGESLSTSSARELITAVVGGLIVRTLARQAARLLPVAGWIAAGGMAAAGTWALGRTVIAYFESDKQLGSRQLRDLYGRMLRTPPDDEDG